jgi:hypothetical protein
VEIADGIPAIMNGLEEMKALTLTDGEREAFAESAAILRYGSIESAPVRPFKLLASNRNEDSGSDMWRTFSTVQENCIRGGQKDFNKGKANGQRMPKSRASRGRERLSPFLASIPFGSRMHSAGTGTGDEVSGRLDPHPGGYSQVPGENGPPPSSSEPGFSRITTARFRILRQPTVPLSLCGDTPQCPEELKVRPPSRVVIPTTPDPEEPAGIYPIAPRPRIVWHDRRSSFVPQLPSCRPSTPCARDPNMGLAPHHASRKTCPRIGKGIRHKSTADRSVGSPPQGERFRRDSHGFPRFPRPLDPAPPRRFSGRSAHPPCLGEGRE